MQGMNFVVGVILIGMVDPQGFGFGRALDAELMSVFGVELEAIEARELIDIAKE